jgi:hypothetical protein
VRNNLEEMVAHMVGALAEVVVRVRPVELRHQPLHEDVPAAAISSTRILIIGTLVRVIRNVIRIIGTLIRIIGARILIIGTLVRVIRNAIRFNRLTIRRDRCKRRNTVCHHQLDGSREDVGGGEPSSGADVDGASPVPVQMW